MRIEANTQSEDIFSENEINASIQDAASSLYYYSKTNTPYSGPVCYLPGYGFLANSSYRSVYIPLVLTEDNIPNRINESRLNEVLSNANLATGLTSFFVQTSGVLQSNELFYWDDVKGKFVQTTKGSIRSIGYRAAKDMTQVSKSFVNVVAWVNVAIVGGEVFVNGFDVNTSADAIVCAIGFIPGLGWVIAGVYTITNTIVTGATGKTIPEHIRDLLFEKYYQFINELEKWIMSPFTSFYGRGFSK